MKILFPLLLVFILTACGENSTTNTTEQEIKSPAVVDNNATEIPAVAENMEQQYIQTGSYVGEFKAVKFGKGNRPSYTNRITIVIDEIQKNKLKGHSVVAGNIRPFEGLITSVSKAYAVHAEEPGDDKYDGVFDFVIDPIANQIKGTWTANDTKLAVIERNYTLNYQPFKYFAGHKLPDDVSWRNLFDNQEDINEMEGEFITEAVTEFNPSAELLKKEDVENMYQGDLEVLRNSIYARHGYSFKNRKMRYVFDTNVDWYVPISTDVRANLTDLEKKNIELLKRYEQHAEKYYDSFGR